MSPFTLVIEKISFTHQPINSEFLGDLYGWTGTGAFSYVQEDKPENFVPLAGSLRIKPGEQIALGFMMASKDGESITASGLQYHGRLSLIPITIKSSLRFILVPDPH